MNKTRAVYKGRSIVFPEPLYSGATLIGNVAHHEGRPDPWAGRRGFGEQKFFRTRDEAVRWVEAGHEAEREAKDEARAARPVSKPRSAPAPSPRPQFSPSDHDAQCIARIRAMKLEQLEALGRKHRVEWAPVAPNPGVYKMRVLNAVIAAYKRGDVKVPE